jgi:hypothetical protein
MSNDRRFALVTLVDSSGADEYYIRDVARRFTGFTEHFETIDVRRYRADENTAAVTLLDRFALFAAMYYEGVPYERLLEQLDGTPNLVLLTSDLHTWSLFPDLIRSEPDEQQSSPDDNEYGRMFEMFDRLNIGHLITSYDCPELEQINALRPELQTYVVDLHVDTSVFRDRREEKVYDVIVYGVTETPTYVFRHRVLRLLLESRQLRVLRLQPKHNRYDERVCGVGLARMINQSWLGLATVTDFSYLVGKYFEIPACNTAVLGDMNDQGAAIFGENYVHIDEEMTDGEILETVDGALDDREDLEQKTGHMYRVIHDGYTLADLEEKLGNVARRIAL